MLISSLAGLTIYRLTAAQMIAIVTKSPAKSRMEENMLSNVLPVSTEASPKPPANPMKMM
jgi:hypothetical protein